MFNQRSVDGILATCAARRPGRLRRRAPTALAAELEQRLAALGPRRGVAAAAAGLLRGVGRAADFGIRWVSELIAIAGGDDVFPELARAAWASDRIIADPLEAVRRAPDIIFGSWCGKKFSAANVAARPGWQDVPAVRDGELHEIKSPTSCSPGRRR